MKRAEVTEKILTAKRLKELSWEEIAKKIGGACVTPTRKVPRFLVSSRVPACAASGGNAAAANPNAAPAKILRRLIVMSCLPSSIPPKRTSR